MSLNITQYIVIGGELESVDSTVFRCLPDVQFIGVFNTWHSAHAAWKANAHRTVDNAHMRFFIVPISDRTCAA
jgi:hypothetical protein